MISYKGRTIRFLRGERGGLEELLSEGIFFPCQIAQPFS